ncbi:hypothetical protein NEOKW01_1786 [Nematocida sp. AWRm80]|nr:hypothetical protein NEOKW01_1786 [Nematocida sp. AWRm80]
MGNTQSKRQTHSLHIIKVTKGLPAEEAGLLPILHYIVRINSEGVKEENDIKRILDSWETQNRVYLEVYDIRTRTVEGIEIVRKNKEKIGFSIKLTTEEMAPNTFKVLDVEYNSPAIQSRIIKETDYIIGHEGGSFRSVTELESILYKNRNRPMLLLVYNISDSSIREIEITPTEDGSIGCDLGIGLLNEIPYTTDRILLYNRETPIDQSIRNTTPMEIVSTKTKDIESADQRTQMPTETESTREPSIPTNLEQAPESQRAETTNRTEETDQKEEQEQECVYKHPTTEPILDQEQSAALEQQLYESFKQEAKEYPEEETEPRVDPKENSEEIPIYQPTIDNALSTASPIEELTGPSSASLLSGDYTHYPDYYSNYQPTYYTSHAQPPQTQLDTIIDQPTSTLDTNTDPMNYLPLNLPQQQEPLEQYPEQSLEQYPEQLQEPINQEQYLELQPQEYNHMYTDSIDPIDYPEYEEQEYTTVPTTQNNPLQFLHPDTYPQTEPYHQREQPQEQDSQGNNMNDPNGTTQDTMDPDIYNDPFYIKPGDSQITDVSDLFKDNYIAYSFKKE